MKAGAFVSCLALLAALWPPLPLAAQETEFTSDESGFVFRVTGIEDVDAVAATFQGFRDGDALLAQGLTGNRVEETDIRRRTLIDGSFADGRGILSVNQEVGNMNNQANIRVIVLAATGGSQLQMLDSASRAERRGNTVVTVGSDREDRISDSFGGTRGIVGVNQSSGNLNQQANVLVLGIGVSLGPDLEALGDSSLGQVSADNALVRDDPLAPRQASLEGSFGGFVGIAQISQSPGDLNAVNNTLGVSLVMRVVP